MSIFAKCNTVRYMRKKAQEVLLRLIFTAFLRINSCHFSILKHLVYGGPDGKCLSGGKRQLCARKCRLVSNLMLANTKVFVSMLTHYCNKLAFLGRMVFGSLMPVPTQSSQYLFFRAFGKRFCRRSNPLQLYLYG